MERFAGLVSQLSEEHSRLLQDNERLHQECEELRASAEEWRWPGRCDCTAARAPTEETVGELMVAMTAAQDADNSTADTIQGDCDLAAHADGAAHAVQSWRPGEGAGSFISGTRPEMCWTPKEQLEDISYVSEGSSASEGKRAAPPTSGVPSSHQDNQSGFGAVGRAFSVCRTSTQTLKLWPVWTAEDQLDEHDCELVKKMITAVAANVRSSPLLSRVSKAPASVCASGCLQACVVRPNSPARMTWDALSVLILSYDILSVPMLAFKEGEAEDPPWKRNVDLITTVFWTIDILVSFLSGFHYGGVIEMRLSKICSRYMRGWFLLDFPVVLLDWFITFQQGTNFQEVVGAGRFSKVFRIVRVLRLFRLLRMLKFPQWADAVRDCLRSEGLVTALGVMQSLLIIAVANHFIACAWYLVGGRERPFTWVQPLDDEGRDMAYRYATALHWSVTQFTPASMEVVPRNTTERAFGIVVIFSAMVAFSCFISSITQAMASLQRSSMERDKQQNSMRRYLAENSVSLELGHQISNFVRAHDIVGRRRVHEEDVQVFRLLPDSLRRDLHWEVHAPVLLRHPLFRQSLRLDDTLMQELCHTGMSELSLGRSEELFHPGPEAAFMYFSTAGAWEYRRRKDGRKVSIETALERAPIERAPTTSSVTSHGQGLQEEDYDLVEVHGEACICEVALWLQWELQGSLMATARCACVSLNANKFRKAASSSTPNYIAFKEYAKIYCEWLQREGGFAEVGFSAENSDDILQEALVVAEELNVVTKLSEASSTRARHARGLGSSSWRSLLFWRDSPQLSPRRRRPSHSEEHSRDQSPRSATETSSERRRYAI